MSRTNRAYEVRPLGCDWAMDIPLGDTTVVLYFNSRNNAELVKDILEWEDAHPNEAIPYQPTLTPQNEWVNVEEKLPERYENVIVHYKNGKIEFDWQDGQGNFLLDGEYGRVTHWMPIPAPPDCRPPERNGGSQR